MLNNIPCKNLTNNQCLERKNCKLKKKFFSKNKCKKKSKKKKVFLENF